MEKIRIPLILSRKYLLRAKMDRFFHVSIWRLLLAALLITFGLSFLGREWNTYGILIFLLVAGLFIGLDMAFIRWSAKRQEKKWAKISLIFEANPEGIRVDALPEGDVVLVWDEVKAHLNGTGWVFAIKPFPHYIFMDKTKLTDEENKHLKKWAVKLDAQPPANTWMSK